ncbi:MAG TPA: hypothetical protein VGP93_04345 [Polyangiaceae bacterium]|jgi:hypothetical protein|nr:hypothetical protein [Polyangiaceae bacterium]
MMRKILFCLAIASLIPLAACEKKEEAPSTTPSAESTTTAAAVPTTTPAAVATAAPQIDLETLPTEEEFEDEADKEITPANLEKKLDGLEKEISAE